MENRKTFGAYILRRRTELGMTQRELADKLYVTESAVSKWERGLSYPDITLIQSICAVLDISEHELLTGSDDIKGRNSERLAQNYLRLTRNYRLAQYIIYGLAILVCAIVNLATRHCLDWFFIVLFAVAIPASITLVPTLFTEDFNLHRYRGLISLGCFVASLELLLLSCCLYTGGDWFIIALTGTLLGIAVLILPFFMRSIPFPPPLSEMKTSLYLLLAVALLIILLLACCIYTGGDWFAVAAVSVIFGLGFFILPVLLHQIKLPQEAASHKTLIYFSVQTLLLFALLAITDFNNFFALSLPLSIIQLILPWGMLLMIRYLPVNGYFRASACCVLFDLWLWLTPYLESLLHYGTVYVGNKPIEDLLWLEFNFGNWGMHYISNNIIAIIIFAAAAAAAVTAALGIRSELKKRGRDNT